MLCPGPAKAHATPLPNGGTGSRGDTQQASPLPPLQGKPASAAWLHISACEEPGVRMAAVTLQRTAGEAMHPRSNRLGGGSRPRQAEGLSQHHCLYAAAESRVPRPALGPSWTPFPNGPLQGHRRCQGWGAEPPPHRTQALESPLRLPQLCPVAGCNRHLSHNPSFPSEGGIGGLMESPPPSC
ncbi:hypothetical protein KIL84_022198 [Mauremys mutica]|uniref:Uncharacterized protein n=1 Tax=Mauremys mutica TaxID=74926 RepID=A0A9D3XA74_9SAUR|nr:hypothetical protein KIL84_022198 [Mauremys mutica]